MTPTKCPKRELLRLVCRFGGGSFEHTQQVIVTNRGSLLGMEVVEVMGASTNFHTLFHRLIFEP